MHMYIYIYVYICINIHMYLYTYVCIHMYGVRIWSQKQQPLFAQSYFRHPQRQARRLCVRCVSNSRKSASITAPSSCPLYTRRFYTSGCPVVAPRSLARFGVCVCTNVTDCLNCCISCSTKHQKCPCALIYHLCVLTFEHPVSLIYHRPVISQKRSTSVQPSHQCCCYHNLSFD